MYAEWARVNELVWKLDGDQLVSTLLLLKQYEGKVLDIIPVEEEDGISVVAYALKYPTEHWAAEAIEIAIDGTCE